MKNKIIRRICTAVCAAALFMTALPIGSDTVFASQSVSDIQSEIESIRKQNEDRKKLIDDLGGNIGDNEEAIKLVSEQIDGVNSELAKYLELIRAKQTEIDNKFLEIDAIEKLVLEKETEIDGKKAEIEQLNAENKENLAKFAQLARILYMNDVSDKMPILSGSSDWYDYFVYSDVVKNISQQNYDFMNKLITSIKKQETLIGELNVDIDALEQSRARLEAEKEEFTRQADALTAEMQELEKAAKEKHDYLLGLTAENEELRSKIAELKTGITEGNAALDKLNSELEELLRKEQETQSPGQPVYSGKLRWPLDDHFRYISDDYGPDPALNRFHHAIDIGNSGIKNANIYAAQSGIVRTVVNYCPHNYGYWGKNCGCGGGLGRYIIINHGGGIATLYAHCGSINVYEGQYVNQGDVIGHVGSTGYSTGFHLHFEVRENGTRVNPHNYL